MSEYQQPYEGNQNGGHQNYPNRNQQYGNNSNGNYRSSGGYQNRNTPKSTEPFDESQVRLYKAYVGTGNRDTPNDVLQQMEALAKTLESFGYTLRSSAMDGPPMAFEKGTKDVELHLPWKDFNQRHSKSYFNTDEIKTIAKMFQPTFDGLKPVIQAFLSTNVRTLLGKDLKSRAMFVVLWSADGAEKSVECTQTTGSMAHVIKLATAMKIPVFNLGRQDTELRLKRYLEIINE